ncbi:hypothetical protein ACKF11_01085 [Methylobacillus sp. Pita2]|uniref:hypothetical protein n=1 Tax=Methylobacillus sp. Pita2 TaxID=3383245 RepID=UPI0038B4C26F
MHIRLIGLLVLLTNIPALPIQVTNIAMATIPPDWSTVAWQRIIDADIQDTSNYLALNASPDLSAHRYPSISHDAQAMVESKYSSAGIHVLASIH